MPVVLAIRVKGLATAKVMEEVVELSAGMEKPVAAEEVGILVAEPRIQTETGVARTKIAGVMHAQFLVSSSVTPGNWEFA